ncbi:MAG: transposase [Ardenticatenales bacterium]
MCNRPTYDDAGRMARHLTKHREYLFRFLDDEAVDATNNAAERDIRPAVITRKTGGCNRTQEGANNHAVLASIVVTLRKNDVDVHAYLTALQRDAAPAIATLIKPIAVPARAR